jgi:hypothetical protein
VVYSGGGENSFSEDFIRIGNGVTGQNGLLGSTFSSFTLLRLTARQRNSSRGLIVFE